MFLPFISFSVFNINIILEKYTKNVEVEKVEKNEEFIYVLYMLRLFLHPTVRLGFSTSAFGQSSAFINSIIPVSP